MRLDGNTTAVVTGGASGLGEAIVRYLSSKGVKVVAADLNEEKGRALESEIGCKFFKTNVTDEESVKQLFEFTKTQFQNVHIVVNSAGISAAGTIIYSKGVFDTNIFLNVMMINVVGTFNVSKYAALYMSKQELVHGSDERGVIINISSVAGEEGQKGQVAYSASKGAILGMTLPMARDLGKFRIRVVAIQPGIFQTPMTDVMPEKVLKGLKDSTPLGRLGKAEELAHLIGAISENSYVNGTNWRLDGGIRMPLM